MPLRFAMRETMDQLLTGRLCLRKLRAADAGALVSELNNYEVSRNTARIPFPYARTDAEAFLAWAATLDGTTLVRAITLRDDPGVLQGVISYEWSDAQNNAELGYWLAPRNWGKGLSTEAARAMTGHYFEHHPGHDLIACYHEGNEASRRILQRLGFEFVRECASFSRAQNRDVPVTHLRLTSAQWQAMNSRSS